MSITLPSYAPACRRSRLPPAARGSFRVLLFPSSLFMTIFSILHTEALPFLGWRSTIPVAFSDFGTNLHSYAAPEIIIPWKGLPETIRFPLVTQLWCTPTVLTSVLFRIKPHTIGLPCFSVSGKFRPDCRNRESFVFQDLKTRGVILFEMVLNFPQLQVSELVKSPPRDIQCFCEIVWKISQT